MMQIQVTRQQEVELMERRLKDEIFSHIGLSAEATRPASSTLSVISSVESDVNESVHLRPLCALICDLMVLLAF